MAVMRKSVGVAGRLVVLGVVAVLAVWVVWTWPWAPLVWLGAALALVAAMRILSRR